MSDAKTLLQVQQVLSDLDLNDKEIKIYLALLTVGTSPASTLGDRTNIQRSTAQYTCQQLERKGIIRMVQKGNTYLYTPEQPEKLLLLLDKERQEITRKEEKVNHIVGALKSIMNPHAVLPGVRFYEGPDGIMDGYLQAVEEAKKSGEILSFLHALDDVSDEYGLTKKFETVTKKMETFGIKNRIISPDSVTSRAWKKNDDPSKRETRLVAAQPDLNPTEIMLFGDSLYAMAVEEQQIFGFYAKNHSIVSMFRMAFELLWESSAAKR